MKKIIYLTCALLLTASTNTFAFVFDSGLYLGGQFGWGRLDEGKGFEEAADHKNVERGVYTAWRVYGGYSFLPLLSIEGGYSHYPESTYGSGSTYYKNETYTIDLVGKLIIPIGILSKRFERISIFGKAGGAYVNTKFTDSSGNRTTSPIRPTYGAGIIFNFTENIAMDVSWTGIMGKNRAENKDGVNNRDIAPYCNMFTVGLSYKFPSFL